MLISWPCLFSQGMDIPAEHKMEHVALWPLALSDQPSRDDKD